MALFHGNAIPSGAEDYTIDYSLRFNSADNAYLTWTPGSDGNRTTYTFSFWMKRTELTHSSVHQYPFSAGTAGNFYILNGTEQMGIQSFDDGTDYRTSSRVFRDTTNWYHIVVAVDTTQTTDSNRVKFYVNGSEVTDWDGSTAWPAEDGEGKILQSGEAQIIGQVSGGAATKAFDGYMAEFHFVEGHQLTPSSFGKTDATYGHWKPKEYTGSHGSNGFFLDFADSSSLGNDASANSNNFTATNITASDQSLDTPTNNWCTFNNLDDAILHKGTFEEGNLKYTGASTGNPWGGGYNYQGGQVGTIYTSNKFYYEWYVGNFNSEWMAWGIAPDDYRPSSLSDRDINDTLPGRTHNETNHGVSTDINYNYNYYDGSSTSSANQSAFSNGDIVMVAFDPATGKYWWGRNGTWEDSGNPATGANPIVTLSNLSKDGVAHTWTAFHAILDATHWVVYNFGQDGTFGGNVTAGGNADGNGYGNFKYSVPSGFLSLCQLNMDEPTITPSEHFSATIRTGDNSQAVTGIGFQPDLVWSKTRNQTHSHQIHDSVRGATDGMLNPDTSDERSATYQLDSFDSDGFTIDSGNLVGMNGSGNTYVTWAWKAGTTTSGTTSGSGTGKAYSASYNSSAGFSIISYLGNGSAGHTIPHHLSKAPELVIVKRRDNANNWAVGQATHDSYEWDGAMKLDSTEAWSGDNRWNDTAPTSSVFSLSSDVSTNYNDATFISYCFHSVEGYSKIGSYLGIDSADGVNIYLGFKPSFVLIKNMSNAGNNWVMLDDKRSPINSANVFMLADSSAVEQTLSPMMDFLSNGIKLRATGNGYIGLAHSFLYYAIAEQPFKYSNAR